MTSFLFKPFPLGRGILQNVEHQYWVTTLSLVIRIRKLSESGSFLGSYTGKQSWNLIHFRVIKHSACGTWHSAKYLLGEVQ